MTENICALATAQGGAIAIIRLSGPDAIAITDRHFIPKNGKPLSEAKGQTLHFGHITASPKTGNATAEHLDEVLVSVFRAPHSYTGEDTTEISCHSSKYITNTILQALIQSGCRMATPGEFTKRAYLNGRLDLSQAEAVADLIASTNAATHRIALSQLRGNFSSELSLLRDRLLHLTSLLELELDFSDHEELEFADRTQLLDLAQEISDKVWRLADSFKTGQAMKRGIPVAIIGKTNVGKSTLLNRLLREDRAIVSDIHGTTRDVIEDTINIHGIDFRFIDTAGLRDTHDAIERLGIERTHKKMQEASIIIHLADEITDFTTTTYNLQPTQKLLQVLNKIDLINPSEETTTNLIRISAKNNIGIDKIEQALIQSADIPEINENDVIITSARHYEALTQAHHHLQTVINGMSQGVPSDLLSEDLRCCINTLAEITGGAITTYEVLNNIFSHFCIGK